MGTENPDDDDYAAPATPSAAGLSPEPTDVEPSTRPAGAEVDAPDESPAANPATPGGPATGA